MVENNVRKVPVLNIIKPYPKGHIISYSIWTIYMDIYGSYVMVKSLVHNYNSTTELYHHNAAYKWI